MRKQKFRVGDVLVDGRGWKRKIVGIIENHRGNKGQFGCYYVGEILDKESGEYVLGTDHPIGLASQDHLIRIGFKICE